MDERKFSRLLLTNETKRRKNLLKQILHTLKTIYIEKPNIYHDWIFEHHSDICPLTLNISKDNNTQLLYIYEFQKYLQTLDESFQEIDNSHHIYHLRTEYQKIGQNITFPNVSIIKKPFQQDCTRVRWFPFVTDPKYIPQFENSLMKKALMIMYVHSYVSEKTKIYAQSYLLELTNE
jgi:hypothetical protein